MPLYKQRQQKMRCKIALIFVKSIYIYVYMLFTKHNLDTTITEHNAGSVSIKLYLFKKVKI